MYVCIGNLILIVWDEVTNDLAEFDIKLQKFPLCTLFFNIPIAEATYCKPFELMQDMKK
jgi:hypothetical protein